jgi:hypothetical protein
MEREVLSIGGERRRVDATIAVNEEPRLTAADRLDEEVEDSTVSVRAVSDCRSIQRHRRLAYEK